MGVCVAASASATERLSPQIQRPQLSSFSGVRSEIARPAVSETSTFHHLTCARLPTTLQACPLTPYGRRLRVAQDTSADARHLEMPVVVVPRCTRRTRPLQSLDHVYVGKVFYCIWSLSSLHSYAPLFRSPFYPLPFYFSTFSLVTRSQGYNYDTSLWLCTARAEFAKVLSQIVAGHFRAWRNHRLLFIFLLSTPAHILAPSHDVT